VKSDRKPRTVSSCVSVQRRMTTGDTWFRIKEASAACVNAILSNLKDYTSGIKHMMNSGIENNAFSDYDKHTNTEEQTSNCLSQAILRAHHTRIQYVLALRT
jgi:hypothetical protein